MIGVFWMRLPLPSSSRRFQSPSMSASSSSRMMAAKSLWSNAQRFRVPSARSTMLLVRGLEDGFEREQILRMVVDQQKLDAGSFRHTFCHLR